MNFFVVDTGFQLLSAIEARDALAASEVNHLILEARGADEGRHLNLQQMLDLNDGKWASVTIARIPRQSGPKRSIKRLWNFWSIRWRIGRARRVFIGTSTDKWAFRIARILGRGDMIRLDDGTYSVPDLRARRQAAAEGKAFPANQGKRFTLFRRPQDLIDPVPGIITHQFETFRAQLKPVPQDSNLVWMLGGAYAESRFITEDREVALFAQLRSLREDAAFLYLPHRADLPSKLERIAELGIKIAAPGPTFEHRLTSTDHYPGLICGVASTALVTAHILVPQIKVIAIAFNPSVSANYDVIYDELRAMGMDVIPEA